MNTFPIGNVMYFYDTPCGMCGKRLDSHYYLRMDPPQNALACRLDRIRNTGDPAQLFTPHPAQIVLPEGL